VTVSEKYRKRFSEKLRESLSKNDIQQNQIFELNQSRKLAEIQNELIESKLNMIFDSINAISNAKNLEDKYQFEINQLKTSESSLINDKQDLNQLNSRLIKERDAYREECKEMVDIKARLEREREYFTRQNKENIQKLNGHIKKLTENLDHEIEENIN